MAAPRAAILGFLSWMQRNRALGQAAPVTALLTLLLGHVVA